MVLKTLLDGNAGRKADHPMVHWYFPRSPVHGFFRFTNGHVSNQGASSTVSRILSYKCSHPPLQCSFIDVSDTNIEVLVPDLGLPES